MGRHKQQIILSLKPRPQILLNSTSLEEEPAKIMEMENAIKKFQSSLKSKQPLTKKSITFQNWRKSIPVPATFDDWILFLNFLVDDCFYFAEDRKRISSSSGHNVDSWRTQNGLAACQREHASMRGPDISPNSKQPQPQAFHPALNQALWDRYQGMRQELDKLASDVAHITCDKDIGLYHIFLKANKFLGEKHAGVEADLEHKERARLLTQMKENLILKQLFLWEDIDDISEFYVDLHSELVHFDPYALTHALIWFFYLADQRTLPKAYHHESMDAVKYQDKHFYNRSYNLYCEKFLELQRLFPPERDQKQVIEIQQELFLLMTGLFQKGCNDPKFQDLPSVRFYREICKIADQRATPDPAILWSYPWGQEQKEEYYRDGNIKIYHTLYNDILKNPIIIRKEKRKLEKELESSLAGEDDPSLAYKIQLLHDLAYSSKDKTLDENGDLCYRDSTNKPDFFDDPVKLPKKFTPAEMKYLPRCIREYTALSLFQEYFMRSVKETAFNMLMQPYRSG